MKRLFICCLFLSSGILATAQITPPTFEDRFRKKSGNLRLSETVLELGDIRTNEVKSDTVYIFNTGKVPMSILLAGKPQPYLKVVPGQSSVDPGKEGWIAFSYDGSKKNDFGFVLDRIRLKTDDPMQTEKLITITANIREYFPPPAPGDTLMTKAEIPQLTYDYGRIQQGEKTSHSFAVHNKGGRELIIRKAKTDCGCLKATVANDTIAPGASGTINVVFDSFGKLGNDSRYITVFMNDPDMPEARLEIKGEVVR